MAIIDAIRNPVNRDIVAVGSSGRVYRSVDNAGSWQITTRGSGTPIFNGITSNNTNYLLAHQNANSLSLVPVGNMAGGSTSTVPTTSNTGVSKIEFNGFRYVTTAFLEPMLTTTEQASTWRAVTQPSTAGMRKAYWTGVRWIAVGDGGVILTSETGLKWTQRASGTTEILFGVDMNSTMILICGFGGVIRSSTDGGITWNTVTSGTTQNLRAIFWSEIAQIWVAVGASGTIITSTNGTSWTTETSGVTANLLSVAINTPDAVRTALPVDNFKPQTLTHLPFIAANINPPNCLYGRTWNRTGTVSDLTISTAQSVYGTQCANFITGLGSLRLTSSATDFLNLTNGDFFISAWIRPSNVATTAGNFNHIWSTDDIGDTGQPRADRMLINGNQAGRLTYVLYDTANTMYQIHSADPITVNVWTHVAVGRSGNTVYLFVDGVLNGTLDVTGLTFNNGSAPIIGSLAFNNSPVQSTTWTYRGFMQDFRVIKGACPHTATFTPYSGNPL